MKEKVEAFKKDAKAIVDGVEGAEIDVSVQLGAGCMYDPIKDVTPIKGGEPLTLEHKKGEVWLIDVWATWCPPCQAPMAHNEEMLKKRGADWGDKVKFVCIAGDQTAEAVVKHVESKKWERPIHYHKAKSDVMQQYSLSGYPSVMLIDTEGKIVFKGHPANRKDLEKDFDTLLKGEKITGPGTEEEAKPEADSEEGADAGKERDAAKDFEAIDKVATDVFPGLQKNEKITAIAKNMPRAFCVFTYEMKYDISNGKSTAEWKNYRVLVGKQADIDTCKEVIESEVKGDFEVVLREHVI